MHVYALKTMVHTAWRNAKTFIYFLLIIMKNWEIMEIEQIAESKSQNFCVVLLKLFSY